MTIQGRLTSRPSNTGLQETMSEKCTSVKKLPPGPERTVDVLRRLASLVIIIYFYFVLFY